MKKTMLGSVAVVLFLCMLLFVWIYRAGLHFQNDIERHKQSYDDMAMLRDRAKANPPDIAALNALISKVHSKDQLEKTAAIGFLGQVGSNAAPAVDVLIQALNSSNPFDAREAATSLGEVGPPALRAVPDLLKAMQKYPNQDIGWFSAESLGHIVDSNDVEVVAALQQAAKSPDEQMRRSAEAGLQALVPRQTTSQP